MSEPEHLREGFVGCAFDAQLGCPVCLGAASREVGRAANINPDLRHDFTLRACTACNHWWIDPIPSQALLDHLYGRASHSVVGVGWATQVKTRLTVPEQAVVAHERSATPGAYFELGVGKGLLFGRFRADGWSCAGVEPGAWAGLCSGSSADEELYRSLADVPSDRAFDVVIALDVLEHVRDPAAMLRRLRELARPGARVYLAFPNCESFRARLAGARWRMVRPLGHVHFFSRASVEALVKSSGLALVDARATDLVEWKRLWAEPWALPAGLVQLAGMGDQWFVRATV